uniref:Uncharacterized protein n=1 Tax=Craspedostauros australis TaxID=1486917 RepID=A0A7R9ZRK2_9STRA|mmetsp:Transcript_6955/g.18873  ORF Transcript_6955/g.18873 Transcript_6955/m.18873 type:complete len:147 (+) Transcript_6955:262-702(+)
MKAIIQVIDMVDLLDGRHGGGEDGGHRKRCTMQWNEMQRNAMWGPPSTLPGKEVAVIDVGIGHAPKCHMRNIQPSMVLLLVMVGHTEHSKGVQNTPRLVHRLRIHDPGGNCCSSRGNVGMNDLCGDSRGRKRKEYSAPHPLATDVH